MWSPVSLLPLRRYTPRPCRLSFSRTELVEIPQVDGHDDPALAPDVTVAGATFQDDEAVVDGRLVSGRAWPDHPGWMREFIRLLREHAPVEAQTAGATA